MRSHPSYPRRGGRFPKLRCPETAEFPSVLLEGVVRITVQPPLARLSGCDNRMRGRVGVLGGVAIGRRVATPRAAASLAGSKVYPRRADLDAFFAFSLFRMLHRFDSADM